MARAPDRAPSPRHRLIDLPQVTDERGSLGFAEEGKHIPFAVRRLFYLYALAEGASRGGHAHIAQHQLLIMLHGSVTVTVDDGSERLPVRLESPAAGLYVPPLVWIELGQFAGDAVCAVLASGWYDESDYVRDYGRFRSLATPENA
jgi:hypothetical protein